MEKDSYHHGDLHNKILKHAIIKIEEVGIDKLSIREIARDLGISKNAPYRHFKSKGELLAAIANFGFLKITKMMSSVADEKNTCRENIYNMGFKYIEFSRQYPSIYQIMFKMTHTNEKYNPEYEKNGKESFMVLFNQISTGIENGEFKGQDPIESALSVWAYIHGCSSFYIDKINLPFEIQSDGESIFKDDILFEGL